MAQQSSTPVTDASVVQAAVLNVLTTNPVRSAVIQHAGATLLVTKGRRLQHEVEASEGPADYPAVKTSLKDDTDSWLR